VRNYADLSHFDFECLVRDLLQSEWNDQFLEVFPPGPDGGVDIRVLRSKSKNIYVQCKHYLNSRFPDLRKAIIKEASSISSEILAGEYWLVTSQSLTAHNKKSISDLFQPGFLSENRILGKLDLDNLLNRNPQVELANYKLYMTSAPVMQRLLHAETAFRRQGFFMDVRNRVRTYVETPAFSRAKEILEKRKTCIITGEPGVGKTALAEMLILDLVEKGFECIPVSRDIEEAERAFNPEIHQVFYYDDFLGQTSLGASKLHKNEDSRLISFMERLQRGSNHFFILTTREYILRQVVGHFEKMDSPILASKKMLLELSDYSRTHRYRILYNHLFYSNLDPSLIATMSRNGGYGAVVSHKNYNPRLIGLAIQLVELEDRLDFHDDLKEFFIRVFNSPIALWKHAFNDHLSSAAQDCLIVLCSIPRDCGMRDLMEAMCAFQNNYRGKVDPPHVLRRAISEIDGVFLNSYFGPFVFQEEAVISIANPSFRDYLHIFISENPEIVLAVIESAVRFEQCLTVLDWIRLDNQVHTSLPDGSTPVMIEARALMLTKGRILVESMLRLLTAESCGVVGFGMLLSHAPVDQGERVRSVVLAGLDLNLSADEMDPIILMLAMFIASGRGTRSSGIPDKENAISALKLLHANGFKRCSDFSFEALGDSVENWFKNSLDSPEDFTYMIDAAVLLHGVDTEVFESQYGVFVEKYWDNIKDRDSYSLKDALESIADVADSYYLSSFVDYDEMESEIEEAERREEEEFIDEEEDIFVRDETSKEGSVSLRKVEPEVVDDLFGTL